MISISVIVIVIVTLNHGYCDYHGNGYHDNYDYDLV